MANSLGGTSGYTPRGAPLGNDHRGMAFTAFPPRQGLSERLSGAGGLTQIEFASLSRLSTNELLSALPGEDFARLLPHLEPASHFSGESLYKFGEDVRHVYFPENAVVSQLHVLADGSMIEAALIGREGVLGLSAIFNSAPAAHLTQVAVAGSTLRVRAEILRHEFERGGALRRRVLGYASARMQQLSQRAVCNGRHGVEKRLCSWLLMVHDRAGDVQLSLTHEQIAQHLGARRAGVTIVATDLKNKKIIAYSRGTVRILDRARLEAAACECYPADKETFAGPLL
ncbi:MAG: Crp/Fnr family transcriptional regulator [Pyrinomonadaceae bacterium]